MVESFVTASAEHDRRRARWRALELQPPTTAATLPDPNVFLREHPDYRKQVASALARANELPSERPTDSTTGANQGHGSDKR